MNIRMPVPLSAGVIYASGPSQRRPQVGTVSLEPKGSPRPPNAGSIRDVVTTWSAYNRYRNSENPLCQPITNPLCESLMERPPFLASRGVSAKWACPILGRGSHGAARFLPGELAGMSLRNRSRTLRVPSRSLRPSFLDRQGDRTPVPGAHICRACSIKTALCVGRSVSVCLVTEFISVLVSVSISDNLRLSRILLSGSGYAFVYLSPQVRHRIVAGCV